MHDLLYNKLARYYDLIYAAKDYKSEAAYLVKLIRTSQKSRGKDLLEVACGTGRYLEHFERKFTCTGLDLNPEMLRIAKQRSPRARLVPGHMSTFDLGERFDVVACLFSSIGYIHGYQKLKKTILNFSRHLHPGGVLLIAPWISKEEFEVGRPHLQTYEDSDLKVARAVVSKVRRGDISVINFNWMIAERNKPVRHVVDDLHELAMYSKQEFLAAMKEAEVPGRFIRRSKDDRGLYVGVRS